MPHRFCHVHNHTEYSLLDGANRIPQMVARAGELGMDALAISDHGVMFGVMEFYFECKKQGIKPIIGLEAYVAPRGLHKKTGREENETYHLLLLAKDLDGYRNLCKLSTVAALEGYYYKPRIDHGLLRKHSKGLIGTSACLGSEVCQELLKDNYRGAREIAAMYSEIFGEGNFFIELQDHGLAEQRKVYEPLKKIAQELALPLVATNDAHYLCREDSRPHDVLLCIQTNALYTDRSRMRFETENFYLKSPDEMATQFSNDLEALENSIRIADMCSLELSQQRAAMPKPDLPDGLSSSAYLRRLSEEGLIDRIKDADERAKERLDYELSVIEKTGFDDYFLLVREFANATRERGIYYGVRGSAAGSLVSYCIGITDVDPLEYGLTFERFLNPERVSMPDIDMDFEDARRDEVIRYVQDKYGADHVAQIITFGTLGAKAAIKDCGRVLGYAPQETDRICKTIPAMGYSIERAYKELLEFREIVDSDPKIKTLVEVAKSVEGISRHAGVHAAGVVISRDPLMEHIPLYRGNDGQAITAFEMGILEKIGLLKMDFLGLSNLTVLARAVENIRSTRGISLDVQKIPDGDERTYEMLGRGETSGVFQLEGGGMTRYVAQLKPRNVRDLAAMVALYRPGPMEHIPRFIEARFGKVQPEYLDDRMKPILEETYGIIVYQDQVLQVVQALAGFSLGRADILRRAMGKKDPKAMREMKSEFLSGARANGVADSAAERLWELLVPFAGYAFNKAHAVCYALLAYQTAYLKANYPIEYMAALLAVYRSKEDRVTAFIEECRRQRIQILPPDVNSSFADFTIEGIKAETASASKAGAIRFGLAAIKGVGEGLVQGIIQERELNGPFQHLYELAERLRPYGLTKIALEALIQAGALDAIDANRNKMSRMVEASLAYADSVGRDRLAGQSGLFVEGEGMGAAAVSYPVLPDAPPPTRSEVLAMEKEVMGVYLSDHPLRGYERLVASSATHSCSVVRELDEGASVRLAGVIASVRQIVTKSKGERMATFVLEDFSGQIGVIAFPATFAKLREKLEKDTVVQVSGVVTHRERNGERSVEVRLEEIKALEPRLELVPGGGLDAAGFVTIRIGKATPKQLVALKQLLEASRGAYEVVVQVVPEHEHDGFLTGQQIDPSPDLVRQIKACLARAEVQITHPKGSEPAPAAVLELATVL